MDRSTEKDLPNWSAYLRRLGGQAPQAAAPDAQTNRAFEPVKGCTSIDAKVTLGIWSYYFIAKLVLFGMGVIAFHPLENLAFAAFILLFAAFRLGRGAKNAIVAVLAIALLYYDSWLPPINRLFSQASLLSNFSFAYFVELLARFINWSVIGALIVVWGLYWIVARRLRVGALVVASMVAVGLIQHLPTGSAANKTMPDMNKVLQDFFSAEAQRSVVFSQPQASAVPFDVIFLHVCSLAWDDVLATGLEQHPLWQRFDILLTKFNSAASYSGPGAIHLLRATCGQQEHGRMYSPVPEKCYLMNSLLRSGFEPNLALNHDGKFDDFLGQVQVHGRLTVPPMALDGINVAQYAFDESPIYDDLSVLNRWLDTRQKSASPRVALYYNTVSLHDGNHLVGTNASPNSLDTYKVRLTTLLDNMENFMKSLEASGRRAVVVMVPEHGAAVRGDKKQIAGLREIPTPAISLVPVGIKVIGGNIQREGDTLSIDQPSSYLAISYIVERMLQKSPFESRRFAPSEYVADLPVTPFVAQNEQVTVAEYNHRYYLNRGSNVWEDYAEFNGPEGK